MRISWLIVARKADLAAFAFSARSFDAIKSAASSSWRDCFFCRRHAKRVVRINIVRVDSQGRVLQGEFLFVVGLKSPSANSRPDSIGSNPFKKWLKRLCSGLSSWEMIHLYSKGSRLYRLSSRSSGWSIFWISWWASRIGNTKASISFLSKSNMSFSAWEEMLAWEWRGMGGLSKPRSK